MTFPQIDPVAFALGPLKVHWYGLMYLIGFAAFYVLGTYRARQPGAVIDEEQVSDVLFYGILGVLIGGRIGYMLFYNSTKLMADPLSLFYIWQGGMSFHGGLVGVIFALWLWSRHHHIDWIEMFDFVAPLVPIGIGAGRIGNFINGELWGRATDMPWAMVFPHVDSATRHPSQLYEFALEGVLLFIILWWYSTKPRPRGRVAALFLILYGVMRIGVELFREPDAHIGFLVLDWVTIGQLLSLPLVLFGIWLWLMRPQH